MIPTIVVLRIDGHGTEHLSLHTKRQQALDTLVEVGRKAWRDRFDYDLPGLDGPSYRPSADDPQYVSDRLVREGWRVRVEEREVTL